MSESDAVVTNNEPRHRYEIAVDDVAAGYSVYKEHPDNVVFVHTVIEPKFEGRGLGGQLIKAALDDVRSRGKTVTPLCPFVAAYIRKHPEYLDVVDEAHRSQLGA